MYDIVIIILIIFTIGIGVRLVYIVGKKIFRDVQDDCDYHDSPNKLDDFIYEKELDKNKWMEEDEERG